MIFNKRKINEVIIDQHYKINHPEVSDQIILKLVKKLDGKNREHEANSSGYLYYVEEPIYLNEKPYRLIFMLENKKNYLGVINAFRVKEKKYGISF